MFLAVYHFHCQSIVKKKTYMVCELTLTFKLAYVHWKEICKQFLNNTLNWDSQQWKIKKKMILIKVPPPKKKNPQKSKTKQKNYEATGSFVIKLGLI